MLINRKTREREKENALFQVNNTSVGERASDKFGLVGLFFNSTCDCVRRGSNMTDKEKNSNKCSR